MYDIQNLANKAIKMALDGVWAEAVLLNTEILKIEPKNIPALLRLAKAQTNIHKLTAARRTYRQVLALDKYNPIAKRNISRLAQLGSSLPTENVRTTTAVFLEEPGKTKSVYLVRLTDDRNLAQLEIGEPVDITVNPKSVCITKKGKYLGRLPDDLAFRLIHLIRNGNKYEANIRFIETGKLQIFIREIKKSKRNEQIPSFPAKSDQTGYQAFLPPDLLNQDPLILNYEEDSPED